MDASDFEMQSLSFQVSFQSQRSSFGDAESPRVGLPLQSFLTDFLGVLTIRVVRVARFNPIIGEQHLPQTTQKNKKNLAQK